MGTTAKHIDPPSTSTRATKSLARRHRGRHRPGGQPPLAGGKATFRAAHALLLPTAVYLGRPDRRQFK